MPLLITQPNISVSNIGETAHATNGNVTGNNVFATAFTTGGATTDRLTLRSVVLDIVSGGQRRDRRVGPPGKRQQSGEQDRRQPDGHRPATGKRTFSASGITLAGGTTYFVRVARSGSSANRNLTTTASKHRHHHPVRRQRLVDR